MSVGFIPTLSAPAQENLSQSPRQRGLTFTVERSRGVLVVFELDHRVTLLEPFNMMHKAIFADSPFTIGVGPQL
jgi:hypothetical protein